MGFSKRQQAERERRAEILARTRENARNDPATFIVGLLERQTPLSTKQIGERFDAMGIVKDFNLRSHLEALEKDQRIYHVAKRSGFEMWYSGPPPVGVE